MPATSPNPHSDAPHAATNNWEDAPGGDLSFDQLFTPDEGQPTTATSAQPEPQPQDAPPEPKKEDFFFQAGDSVYKSEEDLRKGIAHKDALIKQDKERRERLLAKGIDPDTGDPLKAPTRPSQKSYLQDELAYATDLADSLKKGDFKGMRDTHARLAAEVVSQLIGPAGPLIQNFAKRTALEAEASKNKDIIEFVSSDAYKQTLDAVPVLKEGIERAEHDLQLADKLPELYRTAYYVHRGIQLPEIIKNGQSQAAPPVNNQPVRPTMTGTSGAPPVSVRAAVQDYGTSEGRKAIIEQAIARGVLDAKF